MKTRPLLQVQGVTVRFGGITALDRVSFDVARGHIVGLIGPNGAGKTTLFNCLSRLYRFSEGAILFEGQPLVDTPAHGIARLGIGRTFQNLALFRTMTVRQNVMLGGHCRTRSGFVANALGLPSVAREERQLAEHAQSLIDLL
jgi:branched-chain amino acid transport system ATP-binding protein